MVLSAARVSVVGDPGDLHAAPGSRPWAVAVRLELLGTLHDRNSADDQLQRMRSLFCANEGWRVLTNVSGKRFQSWEAFCEASPPYGLGTTAAHVEAEVVRRLGPHGGDRKSPQVKNQAAPGRLKYGSNHAAYLLARLDRDHPALAARVHAGKLKPKTAARLAGIIKTQTALDQLRSWWRKASSAERRRFLEDARDDCRPCRLLGEGPDGGWRTVAVGPAWFVIDLSMRVRTRTQVVTLDTGAALYTWHPGSRQ